MIEGLQIEMHSSKLKSLLDARVRHHTEKAEWYRKQVENLTKEIEDNPSVSNNPIQSLRNSQTSHEAKATFFLMLSDNIIGGETYRLTEENCVRIELYARYF